MARQQTPATRDEPAEQPAQGLLERAASFSREFTAGVNQRDVERLFKEDATHAFRVLTDHQGQTEEKSGFWAGVKAFFRGMVLKLTPARRLLFVASLVFSFAGPFEIHRTTDSGSFDFSLPAGSLLGTAGFVLLVALELVDRLRVRDELQLARELQRDLLPAQPPVVAGWVIACSYRTANEIGGDYYDFVPTTDGRLAIAIGDASGHGIGAGLLMAIASATLRTAVDLHPEPCEVVQLVNRVLLKTGGRRAFLTLFYALLDPATGQLEWACAGHPFPLVRRLGGEVEELGRGAFPLGLRREVEVATGETTLALGDTLVLYTDGLPEAMGGPVGGRTEAAFGFDRLRELTADGGAAQPLHDRILAELDRHRGERGLTDDVTLVVVARVG